MLGDTSCGHGKDATLIQKGKIISSYQANKTQLSSLLDSGVGLYFLAR